MRYKLTHLLLNESSDEWNVLYTMYVVQTLFCSMLTNRGIFNIGARRLHCLKTQNVDSNTLTFSLSPLSTNFKKKTSILRRKVCKAFLL